MTFSHMNCHQHVLSCKHTVGCTQVYISSVSNDVPMLCKATAFVPYIFSLSQVIICNCIYIQKQLLPSWHDVTDRTELPSSPKCDVICIAGVYN